MQRTALESYGCVQFIWILVVARVHLYGRDGWMQLRACRNQDRMEIKLYRWMLLLLAAGWCCELPSVHVRLSRVVRAMRTVRARAAYVRL